jgi:GrpB-like predicted nucleotidyltransferase (UPF0157 family)
MTGEPFAIVPADPDWPARFEAERALLERLLAPWLEGGIHHIGSTAVPGLVAKPVIDMMAGVRDLSEARAAFDRLDEHAYRHAPHRPRIAHHFVKTSPGRSEVTHNLHLTEPGGDLWRERLAFRDALRTDGGLASGYEELKLHLAQVYADNPAGYSAGKRDFVAAVLAPVGILLGRR